MSPIDFTVPDSKKIRLIIDTDAKNEADDQYAIVHALLTPKFLVKGVIGAHFGDRRGPGSMNESYLECRKVLRLAAAAPSIPIAHGSALPVSRDKTPPLSEGSALIISEAMSEDPHPLFCIFLGPLTDLAVALLHRPEIAHRMTAVWVGGNAWPDGGPEFNLDNDKTAADFVFSSDVELWQIPRDVYNRFKVSLAELQVRVKPYGAIGDYLFTQMVEFNDGWSANQGWPLGETWVLGDSAAVGVLLDPHEYDFEMRPAPRIDAEGKYRHQPGANVMRIYKNLDVRFILEDFYAKLKLTFGE